MEPVVQSSLNVFSPIAEGQGDVLTSRNYRYQPSICTVGHERVQRDHLHREGIVAVKKKKQGIRNQRMKR